MKCRLYFKDEESVNDVLKKHEGTTDEDGVTLIKITKGETKSGESCIIVFCEMSPLNCLKFRFNDLTFTSFRLGWGLI